ncbi:hypothetical protein PA598K_02388 [Paenibacillus sp. 598K]|uniref:chromate transporter n=1 Tax=Paenibacillus sp. 598K TaxID=1117987 RepID=UPI000FFA306C|nr:chromate transporter [Paenibacillus sp. 598K]GBF74058.1 hypothetical protein PA598K_02388 [Paenibacillus sp. 598K]
MKRKLAMSLHLFWSFLKVAPTAFGGGYAMMPAIERECVERRQWMERESLEDLLSIAAAAPGGVGINAAAAVGYRMAGSVGALAAVIGMTVPTFTLILLLAFAYRLIADLPKTVAALQGLKGGIVGLIGLAAWRMGRAAVFDVSTMIILGGTLASLLLTEIHPGWLIASGLCVGSIVIAAKDRLGMRRRLERPRVERQREEELCPEYFI